MPKKKRKVKIKAKTKKAAIKRIKITGSGKLLRRHVRTSHLKVKQSSKTKRRKKKLVEISKSDRKRIKKLLPGVKGI